MLKTEPLEKDISWKILNLHAFWCQNECPFLKAKALWRWSSPTHSYRKRLTYKIMEGGVQLNKYLESNYQSDRKLTAHLPNNVCWANFKFFWWNISIANQNCSTKTCFSFCLCLLNWFLCVQSRSEETWRRSAGSNKICYFSCFSCFFSSVVNTD